MPTREARADFETLTEFTANYTLVKSLENKTFVTNLGIGHKRLFGLLTFIAEIEILNAETGRYSNVSLSYFAECGSDISQALFCWMHGAYKPAYLSLRSSIETFLKAAVGTEEPTIFTEKSMYKLLDLAKDSNTCSGLAQPHFAKIRESYTQLCVIAHSATAAKFTQVNALGMFPKFEEADAVAFIERFVIVVDRMLGILLSINRDYIGKMHFRNSANVLDTLTKEIKRSILGEEA